MAPPQRRVTVACISCKGSAKKKFPGFEGIGMVSTTEPHRLTITQAIQLRQQARDLLDRLVADRQSSERRAAENGKRDPMKFITGRTALDNAIASTRQIIASMDGLVARMRIELDARPHPRPAAKKSRLAPQIKTFQTRLLPATLTAVP